MSRNHTTNVMTIEFRLARHFVTFVILSAGLVVAAVHNDQPALSDHKREGKVFSLFNVVQFKNDPCVSTQSLATGSTTNRNGTCYSTSECSNKGGTKSGSCASGFGVCCVFIASTSSSTINVNDTYIQNPGFPSAYSGTTAVSYTIQKCSNDICYLRLDFEQFTTQGPANSEEPTGGACTDTFTVSTNSGQQIPTICGSNSGQHIYIDLGALPGDSATLNFAFDGASTSRIWDIKASQIPCGANYGPPNGCLQYQTGLTGRITTFNFADATSGHLASQSYSHCIRQESGYCCVQYQLCADDNSWSIDSTTDDMKSGVDSECTLDYVQIETATTGCNPSTTGATFVSKFCLDNFNALTMAEAASPICDCTPPFEVNFRTDVLPDTKSATTPNRGVCLEYMQVPC